MTAGAPNHGSVVVIADDLSGAAELAGAAHDHGLTAVVLTGFGEHHALPAADVIAIDSDTRSIAADDAAARVAEIARAVFAHVTREPRNPIRWIYKKCDSVLRGRVLPEVRALMSILGKCRAVLVPANPGRGRIIVGGKYLVGGVPVDQTAFADDPEYPRRSADVRALLAAGDDRRAVDDAVIVPDAVSAADLARWALQVDVETLPAGGVEFFEALLDRDGHRVTGPHRSTSGDGGNNLGPTLLICGSSAGWRLGRREQCAAVGVPVLTMAVDERRWFVDRPGMIATWGANVVSALHERHAAMMAIGAVAPIASVSPVELAERLAFAAGVAVNVGQPRRLLIEGGGTASLVLAVLGWKRLSVVGVWATGVVELKPVESAEMSVVVKVGSYDWPAALWPPGVSSIPVVVMR